MTLDSGSIRFIRIFAVVLKIYVNFRYILSLRPYITYTHTSRFFVIKFNCFVYGSYYRPIRLRRVVKCVTSRDVARGLAKCDPQSIWNPRKNCGSFVNQKQQLRHRAVPLRQHGFLVCIACSLYWYHFAEIKVRRAKLSSITSSY